MRFLILILAFLISHFSFSQNYIAYHNACNKGAELIEQGLFDQAKEKLVLALKIVDKPLAIDYFNLAKCYSQLDNKALTIQYLELSLKLDYRTKKICSVHYLWFEPILGHQKWNEILNTEYYTFPEQTKKQTSIENEIKEIYHLDRHYAYILHDSIEIYYPNDSSLIKAYGDSLRADRKLIEQKLEVIINEYGWPGLKTTGRLNEMGTVLVHVSNEWFERNSELLIKEIDNGNLMPWDYTNIADRKRYENNLSVLYNGYFSTKDEATDEIIQNCKKIGAPLGKVRTIRAYYRMSDL